MTLPFNPPLPRSFWQDLALRADERATRACQRAIAAAEQPHVDPELKFLLTEDAKAACDMVEYYNEQLKAYDTTA